MKHLSGAPFYGRPLALPKNIRLGWKGSPRTNTLAYYVKSVNYDRKSFIAQAPGLKSFIGSNVSQKSKLVNYIVKFLMS